MIFIRFFFGRLDQLNQLFIKTRQVTDDAQANTVAMQLHHFIFQHMHEQLHEEFDLILGTPPVFATEREQRQVLHAAFRASAHAGTHRFDAALVTGDTRQKTLFRPAPVAIHDDSDVARHARRVGDGLR